MIWTSRKPAVASTPPTKASSSRIDGRAMRRFAVKKNASAQAVAATASGARKLGPVSPWSLMKSPVDWPMLCPIQPTAKSRIAAAIETKMSLKPVMQTELFFVRNGGRSLAFDIGAKRVRHPP